MQKININSFKAFKDSIEISLPANKNLLLYGENGSGKSSIFEAIRLIFFWSKISNQFNGAHTPEEQAQIENDFWSTFNNKITNNDFEINVNDTGFRSFVSIDYQPFLISLENIHIDNQIIINELLNRLDLSINNVDQFCIDNYAQIQNNVNNTLTDIKENLQIEIDNEVDFGIRFIDLRRNITSKIDIRKYFNEAKINLVVLLVLFESIKIAQDSTKKRILVLDDFITSLDAANRVVLTKYVLENFSAFQILIFTHNVSFFNLVHFLIFEHYKRNSKWEFANLYEINTRNNLFYKSSRITAQELIDEFNGIANNDPNQIDILGNRIRQKFEILLYEFSKLSLTGALDESSAIIDRIGKRQDIYCKDGKSIYNLIDEINDLILNNSNKKLKEKIKQKIQEYRVTNLANFKYITKELTLYRKITLHPMSHGTVGLTTFTTKEIYQSLLLIKELELILKDMVNKNTYTI